MREALRSLKGAVDVSGGGVIEVARSSNAEALGSLRVDGVRLYWTCSLSDRGYWVKVLGADDNVHVDSTFRH